MVVATDLDFVVVPSASTVSEEGILSWEWTMRSWEVESLVLNPRALLAKKFPLFEVAKLGEAHIVPPPERQSALGMQFLLLGTLALGTLLLLEMLPLQSVLE